MSLDKKLLKIALACKCPRCGKGNLYEKGLTMALREKCPECGLALAENDVGDAAAVFLIFILGFLLVPLAFLVENLFAPPLWGHAVLWMLVALFLTVGSLRPTKAYILALQYKHRPGDFESGRSDSGDSDFKDS